MINYCKPSVGFPISFLFGPRAVGDNCRSYYSATGNIFCCPIPELIRKEEVNKTRLSVICLLNIFMLFESKLQLTMSSLSFPNEYSLLRTCFFSDVMWTYLAGSMYWTFTFQSFLIPLTIICWGACSLPACSLCTCLKIFLQFWFYLPCRVLLIGRQQS